MTKHILLLLLMAHSIVCHSQFIETIDTQFETAAVISKGDNSPLLLSSNRYGLSSINDKWGYVRGSLCYRNELNGAWSLESGVDMAVGHNMTSSVILQQAYADIHYKSLFMSLGAKEREDGIRNLNLTSGALIESENARPIPQVRVGIDEYVNMLLTNEWVRFKGHIAYGKFFDNGWQRDFVNMGKQYTQDVLYHSKSVFLKFGKKDVFPLEMEIGFMGAAQFGGKMYKKGDDKPTLSMPHRVGDYIRILLAKSGGSTSSKNEQDNALGNHLGSWNLALTGYLNDWRIKLYYEHMFEDGSGMSFGYGAWQDGNPGIEITFPKKGWLDEFVYELMGTKRQTCSLQSEGLSGMLPEVLMGKDNYYNNGMYLGWHHYGYAMGNPLLTSPIYNKDGSITFKNNRIVASHIAIGGHPSDEISYRVMITYTDNYGTYSVPFDRRECQTYSLAEINYSPKKLKGWNFSVAAAIDRGSVTGNDKGGMIKITKSLRQNIK